MAQNLNLPHTGWNTFSFIDNKSETMKKIEIMIFYILISYCIKENTDQNFKILSKTLYGNEFISSGTKVIFMAYNHILKRAKMLD